MSYANAPLVLNSRDATSGQYNSATFNAKGQNLVQGAIKEIAVSEVNFPYDIPNIQTGFNFFDLSGGNTNTNDLRIIISPGFYTGTELAAAITLAIGDQAVASGLTADLAPTCSYTVSNITFKINFPVTYSVDTAKWYIVSPFAFPTPPGSQPSGIGALGKDIFSIMGYTPNGSPSFVIKFPFGTNGISSSGGSAPLAFTQYIDICSAQLCGKQRFPGGSTTNLARRSDVICRLFICDNVSLTTLDVEGTRPFIINRQYVNARIMRWSTENSIGTIDIQLFDDVGQPLTTSWQPRPFAVTFNVYEQTEERDLEAVHEGALAPTKFGAYQNKNAKAWDSLARHQ